MQTYATKPGDSLTQGNGTSGTGWNYYDYGSATDPYGPWSVGSGSEELNGTHDMMGNVWEWMESPYSDPHYGASSSRGDRGYRGGSFGDDSFYLASSRRYRDDPASENIVIGFRVASVPQPGTAALLGIALLMLCWRRVAR